MGVTFSFIKSFFWPKGLKGISASLFHFFPNIILGISVRVEKNKKKPKLRYEYFSYCEKKSHSHKWRVNTLNRRTC